jgi:hypothetical protein
MKFYELEAKMNTGVAHHQPFYGAAPNATGGVSDQQSLDPQNAFYQGVTDFNWMGLRNRFPPIAFLDSDAFEKGG